MALFLCPKGHWLIRAMRGGVMQRLALLPGKGDILSRERMAPVFSHKCKGSCGTGAAGRAALGAARIKGDTLFLEREYPPKPPRERTRGLAPRPRCIGSFRLEELRGLRNRVRCTWLRHGSLRFVTTRNRALLREARVTIVWRRTACWRHCCAHRGTGAKNDRVSGRFLLWESHRAPVRKLRCGA